MSLATKIFAAFCLVFLAGIAQAILALPDVERAILSTYLASLDDRQNKELTDHLGLISLISGTLGLMLIPIALGLRARRVIIAPLRSMSETLDQIGQDGFDLPPPLDRSDEIGNLDRAIRHVAAQLSDPDVSENRQDRPPELDRFRDFAELAADLLWETDTNGRICFISGTLPGLQDQEPGRFMGCPLAALMSVPVDGGATRVLELESRRPLRDLVCRYEGADGPRFCRLSGHAIGDASGGFSGYRGTATEITEEVHVREAEKTLAFQDPLTGLANRRLVEDRIEQALDARALTKRQVAVISLDLDRFKALNDAFGHDLGDAVLKQVGARLKAVAGPQDTVGRLADDTFAIVQATGAQPEAAKNLCLRVLNKLREPFTIDGQICKLTASVGCVIAAPGDRNAVTLLRKADTAMYRAAESGRDTYRIHSAEATSERQARIAMDRDLRFAIESGRLEFRYQPLIATASGQIGGFETLVRWPRAGHGMVYPGEFLSLAEDTGLNLPLGELTLTTACLTAATWPGLSVAVNISPGLFRDEGLLKTVQCALQDSGLPPRLLELELTEATFRGAGDAAMFQFDALHEIGVRLVLDKFGSGPSSLQCLRRLRFDKLKLDRGITSSIARDSGAAAFMRSVFDLAHALSMTTAAEGVANDEQAALLVAQGCGQLQGKLIGKAMTAERVSALLSAQDVPQSETGL